MTDQELLEYAAKAAGFNKFQPFRSGVGYVRYGYDSGLYVSDIQDYWNPLVDDGDALRLAVKLGITVGPELPDVIGQSLCRVSWMNRTYSLGEYGGGDKELATRRAIVRAAAEIGRNMK